MSVWTRRNHTFALSTVDVDASIIHPLYLCLRGSAEHPDKESNGAIDQLDWMFCTLLCHPLIILFVVIFLHKIVSAPSFNLRDGKRRDLCTSNSSTSRDQVSTLGCLPTFCSLYSCESSEHTVRPEVLVRLGVTLSYWSRRLRDSAPPVTMLLPLAFLFLPSALSFSLSKRTSGTISLDAVADVPPDAAGGARPSTGNPGQPGYFCM